MVTNNFFFWIPLRTHRFIVYLMCFNPFQSLFVNCFGCSTLSHLKSGGIPSSWLPCSFDMTLFNFGNFLALWHNKMFQALYSAADVEPAVSLGALIPFRRELSLGSRTELLLWVTAPLPAALPPPPSLQPALLIVSMRLLLGINRSTINHYGILPHSGKDSSLRILCSTPGSDTSTSAPLEFC